MAFNDTDREKIANADIVTFLESKGYKVVKNGRYHVLVDHRSFVIYNRKSFYYFSKNYGGNLYQVVHNFMGYDKDETNKIIGEYIGSSSYKSSPKYNVNAYAKKSVDDQSTSFGLPQKNSTNKHLYAYLIQKRHLPISIINSYIKKGILYEDLKDNCVFVGLFREKPYYAMKRSTHGMTYKGDVAGSFKEVGIMTPGTAKTSNLVLTEAVIDQMSFKALMDPQEKENYLSINGVGSLKNTLNFWLAHYPDRWNTVYFALDNDDAGRLATKNGIAWLKENYPNIQCRVETPLLKDWNEDLCTEEIRNKYPLFSAKTVDSKKSFDNNAINGEYKKKSFLTTTSQNSQSRDELLEK